MTFDEQYKDVLAILQKAKDELAEGNYDVSLFQVRKALETIIKRVCERYAIDVKDSTGKAVNLLDLIDQLGSQGIISKDDVHLLHQIRSLGNKGVHDNDTPPTRRQAQMAINKFSQALTVFKRIETKETEKAAQSKIRAEQKVEAQILAATKSSRKEAPKKEKGRTSEDFKFFFGSIVTFILSSLGLYFTLKYGLFGGSEDFLVVIGSFCLSCLLGCALLGSGGYLIVTIFAEILGFVTHLIPFGKTHARKKESQKILKQKLGKE